ncbi:2-methylisoborneol synthase [Actinomadura harenae]|uniref:Terpene synthase n=2 Tax=Actinomadura harenae TaxID=2483351 RepID=A0A3M2LNP7_9ACTN|nr:2-methylisoborneol synthase [Actinomadura harenae]
MVPVLDVPEPLSPPEPAEILLETPELESPEVPEVPLPEAADLPEPHPEPAPVSEPVPVPEPVLVPAPRLEPDPEPAAQDGDDASSRRIKGLKFHPPLRDDRALADRVNERLMEWAEKEIELYPGDELRAMFLAFDPGRSVVMCHPDAASFEHLVAAGMLYIGENAVDDYFCEPDLGGSPEGLGARLLVAQTAIDPLHTAKEQVPKWLAGIASHPALRSMRSAMNYFERIATPAQAHRYRHDICNLYLGYCAEAACIQTGRTPSVWEYLAHRQFNNFRPCLTITDAVGGYELPASMFARPDVQRATGLASNASTIVNDLFSLRKEMAQERVHHSLPTVIADEEDCGIEEAFQKTIDIHNELMDDFESLSALLAPTDPVLARYLAGLSNWVAGNHEWHSGLVGTRYATSP